MSYNNEIDNIRQGEPTGNMPAVLGISTGVALVALLAIAGFSIL